MVPKPLRGVEGAPVRMPVDVRGTMEVEGVLVVRVLGKGPCRFNALRREVGEISQKVLASTLRDLEENGLVSRTVTPTKPPQVEYALTDLGHEFLRPVRTLAEWVIKNSARIEAARDAYGSK